MKIKLIVAALLGMIAGSLLGGIGTAYFVADSMSAVLTGAWRENSTNALADTTLYLGLLDQGKADVLRNVLLGRLNASTITLAAGVAPGEMGLLKKQVEIAARIKSVQEDQSEIGKMAADARNRILGD